MLKSIFVLLTLSILFDCILIVYIEEQRQTISEIDVNFNDVEGTLKDFDSIRSKKLIGISDSLMRWVNSENEDISRLIARQTGIAQEYLQYRSLMIEDARWRRVSASESKEMINWFFGLVIAHLTCTFITGLLLWLFNRKAQFATRM